MRIALVISLLVLAISAFGDDDERDFWKQHTAFGDSTLDVKQQKDWLEIGRYYAERREWRENPQYRLGKEYFQIYLDRRPSTIASKALDYAFTMWSNVEGGSYEIEVTLGRVGRDEEVWDRVGQNVIDAYSRDSRVDEGVVLLEQLGKEVVSLKGRASILAYLAIHWLVEDNDMKARPILAQLIEWNVPDIIFPPDNVKRAIQDIDSLTVGASAPDFAVQDIDHKPIRLSDYRGKVVILYFWTSWCSPCHAYYPILRRIAEKYPPEKVAIVGVALENENLPAVKEIITSEKMTWPQIVDAWEPYNRGNLPNLYRVFGVPSVFVIDGSGKLLARHGGSALALERSLREFVK